jgi:hypothetical protein
VLSSGLKTIDRKRFLDWAFGHYLDVAHPSFAGARPRVTQAVPETRMVRV